MTLFNDLLSLCKATVVQIAAGCPMADEETKAKRVNECLACDQLKPESFQCGICNCYLKIKIPLETSKCPLDKW